MVKALPIPGLRADLPYGLAAAETVRVRADELVAQAEGVLDTGRIERVHGMRVATRRLRAVLEIYAPCFPPAELKRTLREVKALADALGARRDPDVQLEGLDRFAATLPEADRPGIAGFMAVVREDQAAGNATLAAALQRLDPATLREGVEVLVRAAEEAVPAELRPTTDEGAGEGGRDAADPVAATVAAAASAPAAGTGPDAAIAEPTETGTDHGAGPVPDRGSVDEGPLDGPDAPGRPHDDRGEAA